MNIDIEAILTTWQTIVDKGAERLSSSSAQEIGHVERVRGELAGIRFCIGYLEQASQKSQEWRVDAATAATAATKDPQQ